MSEQWHICRDGKTWGPYSSAELRSMARKGNVAATDLVWREGMGSWVPATAIKGLIPPPVPVAALPPPIPPPVKSLVPAARSRSEPAAPPAARQAEPIVRQYRYRSPIFLTLFTNAFLILGIYLAFWGIKGHQKISFYSINSEGWLWYMGIAFLILECVLAGPALVSIFTARKRLAFTRETLLLPRLLRGAHRIPFASITALSRGKLTDIEKRQDFFLEITHRGSWRKKNIVALFLPSLQAFHEVCSYLEQLSGVPIAEKSQGYLKILRFLNEKLEDEAKNTLKGNLLP